MFEEIKAATWLQKVDYGDPTILSAQEVLRLATIEGAKLLQIDDQVGTLQVGKKADMILIDMKNRIYSPFII